MNYIVFDLEWNQSPGGKEGSVIGFPFEIIEIGAIKLNDKLEQIDTFHQFVRPKVYKKLHYKILEVTHMELEVLNREGRPFPQVVKSFLDWCGDVKNDVRFCTWGSMDLTELQRNMDFYYLENPFPMPLLYYDVQKLYKLLRGGETVLSLDQAVEEMGIQEERPFHQALDDAYYTGKIMGQMEFEKVREFLSMDYYQLPQKKEEEVYLTFPSYNKYVSRIFETKEDALQDKSVSDIICPQCGRTLRKKIRWFSVNQKLDLGLGTCPEHGYVRGKIRIKKAEGGELYVVKTTKFVGEEALEEMNSRRQEVKKKRLERNKAKRQAQKRKPGNAIK
ncbi:MAG: exonuclease domain-containing protein [Lachnospiraceae bacterium]|jgi:inhibitor of KinA sporulation pathway (predicted exonuclease)|nr:exonuclease domain-containing protein [Lachnospiraceae bacterium]